jgi:hypothetical protein
MNDEQYNNNNYKGGETFYDGSGDDETVVDSSGLIPPNDYLCVVKLIQQKQVKSNPNNNYMNVKFHIIDGDFRGRVFYNNYNVKNSNETAQRIGRGEFKKLVLSTIGSPILTLASDLYDKPITVRTKVKHEKGYGDKIDVVNYGPRTGIVDGRKKTNSTNHSHPQDKVPF